MRKALGLFLLGSAILLVVVLLQNIHSADTAPTKEAITAGAPTTPTAKTAHVTASYEVSEIDAQKNEIQTGTELNVQGVLYSNVWTPDNDCAWLLAGRHLRLQHGETDPHEYCKFSILISALRKDGEVNWPSASLVCNTTTEELHKAMSMDYKTKVQVHGYYAASLDFDVLAFPGGHVGVPALDDCTVTNIQ